MATYKTFKRSCTDWKSFSTSRKITVDTGLSYAEVQMRCKRFHDARTPRQIKNGTMLEFTAE